MRWRRRRRWPERRPAPAVRKLSDEQEGRVLATLQRGIDASPVLTQLAFRARSLRGRFYIERLWPCPDGEPEVETVGRLSPLARQKRTLVLEAPGRGSNWFQVAEGSVKKLIGLVAGDTRGTFHGLGALDSSLRAAPGKRMAIATKERQFVNAETGEPCAAQEVLYHLCGAPIEVIAEPRRWYACHREPMIVEVSDDCTQALVRFGSVTTAGEPFGGTCLYAIADDRWQAFRIKPRESDSIATAMAWLEKRKWREWEW